MSNPTPHTTPGPTPHAATPHDATPDPTPHATTATGAHIAAGPPPTSDNTDDLTTLLESRQRATPNRITWILLALVLFLAGFATGALAHATWGPAVDGGGTPGDGGGSAGFSDSFGGFGE